MYACAFFVAALYFGVGAGADPVELGLSKPEDREHAYIQCVDSGEPYTAGGTVVFKVKRVEQAEEGFSR